MALASGKEKEGERTAAKIVFFSFFAGFATRAAFHTFFSPKKTGKDRAARKVFFPESPRVIQKIGTPPLSTLQRF